jgi:hypothetical protein
MLIRAEDTSVYNLHQIERLEIAFAESGEDENAPQLFVLRAFIRGEAHILVGPTEHREEAESALNRIYNMVSERADLHRGSSRS